MNKDVENFYQVIAEAAAEKAPDGWVALRIEVTLFDDYGSADFFYRSKLGEENQFDPGFDGYDAVTRAFGEMRKIMASAGKSTWKSARFDLEASGKFHIDFSYDEPADIFGS